MQSHDSARILLDPLYGSNGGGQADPHGMVPAGWEANLQAEAVKIFVEVVEGGPTGPLEVAVPCWPEG